VVFKGSRDRILKRLLILQTGPKDNRPVRAKGDPQADLLHFVADIAGMDKAAVDPAADLVDYGFGSISFTELANRINARFQTEIASTLFLEHPSVDSILAFLKETLPGIAGPEEADASGGLMPIQKMGSRKPFVCVPGVGGNGHYFYHLARFLGPEQPFYSFQSLGLDGRTEPHTEVTEMAAYHLRGLEPVHEPEPPEPFLLGGHSLGARVAYEMALQLQAAARPVAVLVVFDEVAPVAEAKMEDYVQDDAYLICEAAAAAEAFNGIDLHMSYDELKSLTWEQKIGTMRTRYQAAGLFPPHSDPGRFRGMMEVYKAQRQIRYSPQPKKNPFKIVLFRAAKTNRDQDEAESIVKDPTWGWQRFTTHPVEVIEGPGSHNTLLAEPNVRVVANRLRAVLEAAMAGGRIV
jgi:thioesterase domain-containing protein